MATALILLTSSYTNLTGAAVFTSADLGVAPTFKRLCGHAYSDVVGTLDLMIKMSDGSYVSYQSVPVAAGVPSVFDYPCNAATARARYTNGAGAQAKFQLEVYGGVGL